MDERLVIFLQIRRKTNKFSFLYLNYANESYNSRIFFLNLHQNE